MFWDCRFYMGVHMTTFSRFVYFYFQGVNCNALFFADFEPETLLLAAIGCNYYTPPTIIE